VNVFGRHYSTFHRGLELKGFTCAIVGQMLPLNSYNDDNYIVTYLVLEKGKKTQTNRDKDNRNNPRRNVKSTL
jgi:tmRNA-binding protein